LLRGMKKEGRVEVGGEASTLTDVEVISGSSV
jgi:hypothetical protein